MHGELLCSVLTGVLPLIYIGRVSAAYRTAHLDLHDADENLPDDLRESVVERLPCLCTGRTVHSLLSGEARFIAL